MAKKDDTIQEKKFLVTAEGLQKLKDELENLTTVRRKDVADKLAEAISYGDLSENAEYDAAKNEQVFVERRIKEVEEQIKYAEIIDESKAQKGVAQIGSTVTIKYGDSGEKHEYTIVGSTEADPLMHKISNESPVGEAIIGKKAKDKVKVTAEGGEFEYEIVKVS